MDVGMIASLYRAITSIKDVFVEQGKWFRRPRLACPLAPIGRHIVPRLPDASMIKIRRGALLAVRLFWSFAMNEVVERILRAYQSMCPLDAERAADSRQKMSRYIESLSSAGQRDAEKLVIYGLAYLTELHEGQDPRFTGC
jgi:hypothetical protein